MVGLRVDDGEGLEEHVEDGVGEGEVEAGEEDESLVEEHADWSGEDYG